LGSFTDDNGRILLSERQQKEVALMLWGAYARIPVNAFDNIHFEQVKKVFGIQISGSASLSKLYYPLSRVILQRKEQVLCTLKAFVTTIDLWRLP